MKKVFLLAMLSLGLLANSQVKFGIKGGINLAKLTSTDDIKFNRNTVYHGGLALQIRLGKLAIQPEVLYSAQGAEIENQLDKDKKGPSLKLDYLTVPVMVKFYLIKGLNIEAGPQLSININSKVDSKILGKIDIKDFVHPYDLSFCLGGGYEFGHLFLNARYNFGVTKIFKDASDIDVDMVKDMFGKDSFKNGTFQLSVGLFF